MFRLISYLLLRYIRIWSQISLKAGHSLIQWDVWKTSCRIKAQGFYIDFKRNNCCLLWLNLDYKNYVSFFHNTSCWLVPRNGKIECASTCNSYILKSSYNPEQFSFSFPKLVIEPWNSEGAACLKRWWLKNGDSVVFVTKAAPVTRRVELYFPFLFVPAMLLKDTFGWRYQITTCLAANSGQYCFSARYCDPDSTPYSLKARRFLSQWSALKTASNKEKQILICDAYAAFLKFREKKTTHAAECTVLDPQLD